MNIKTYFYEYKDWYHRQKKINDYHFKINNKFFLTELNKLNIIYQLYKKKNFKLFIKIINFPILTYKLKFLFAFLMPLKVINYFRK